jgi:hypothetical protein
MGKTIRTKGNVEVDKIKIGDIHYEFEYGMMMKSQVIELPKEVDPGYWQWRNKNVLTNEEIVYGVREDMAHYGPNLYDYEAYKGYRQV